MAPCLERDNRIELLLSVWKTEVLPLNESRKSGAVACFAQVTLEGIQCRAITHRIFESSSNYTILITLCQPYYGKLGGPPENRTLP